MSYYYGYGRRHIEFQSNLEKRMDKLEKKFKNLSLGPDDYETVFEINLKTAKKTFTTVGGEKRLIQAKNGKYSLFQHDKNYYPTFGDDYIENKDKNYMCFCCPELMFGDVSIFIVCEVADTSVSDSWAYLIGNDNGSYDKFISFKSYSYSKLLVGGIEDATYKAGDLPSTHSITHKHILSCHWLGIGSCMYANAVKMTGSEFESDLTDIGSPFGSVFFNERFNSYKAATNNSILKGKIYGFKIVTGLLTSAEIIKINKDMMKEYGNII